MKKFKIYINTMSPYAYLLLSVGLTIFSINLCLLAINLRFDMLSGESDIIYRYPQMIKEIILPLYILLPTTFAIDIKERRKNKG